jgi:hypothetical protein
MMPRKECQEKNAQKRERKIFVDVQPANQRIDWQKNLVGSTTTQNFFLSFLFDAGRQAGMRRLMLCC